MLWQTRKRLRQFARQRIENLDVKSASRTHRILSFAYYFVAWNLVGGALVYMFFFARDPETKKRKWTSPGEMSRRVYGPSPYLFVEDEQGRMQQKTNPEFEEWLAEKDAQLEQRKREIYGQR